MVDNYTSPRERDCNYVHLNDTIVYDWGTNFKKCEKAKEIFGRKQYVQVHRCYMDLK